jgi:mono/diheme cytochrome c family protein
MRDMKCLRKSRRFSLAPVAVCTALAMLVAPGRSQEQKPQVNVKKLPVQQTGEIAGANLFRSYCATCHGRDGKGDGPAASALKTTPPDLTVLARNNGGKFPEDHLMHILSNESEYPVHGSKDMPVWGPIFRKMGPDQNMGMLRAHNVVQYLRSIQAK